MFRRDKSISRLDKSMLCCEILCSYLNIISSYDQLWSRLVQDANRCEQKQHHPAVTIKRTHGITTEQMIVCCDLEQLVTRQHDVSVTFWHAVLHRRVPLQRVCASQVYLCDSRSIGRELVSHNIEHATDRCQRCHCAARGQVWRSPPHPSERK